MPLSGLRGIKFSMACKMIVSDDLLDIALSSASRSGDVVIDVEVVVTIGLSTTLAEATDEGKPGSEDDDAAMVNDIP